MEYRKKRKRVMTVEFGNNPSKILVTKYEEEKVLNLEGDEKQNYLRLLWRREVLESIDEKIQKELKQINKDLGYYKRRGVRSCSFSQGEEDGRFINRIIL